MVKIPAQIAPEKFEDAIPIERDKPFNTLLTKEIQRYNLLLYKIKDNLENTLAAMEGLRQHDKNTEETFECLQMERTPPKWIEFSYPSDENVVNYTNNLIERMDYIH